jgi:hypothetical protein
LTKIETTAKSAAARAARADERRVALVQRAHRRHEPDALPLAADRVHHGADLVDPGDDRGEHGHL